MKRKSKRKVPAGQKRGWRAILFGKKPPAPLLPKKLNRKAKALAAANRRAYLGLVTAAVICVGLFAMVFYLPPQILPEQLAASVRSQKTRAVELNSLGESNRIQPVELSSNSINSVDHLPNPGSETKLNQQLRPRYLPVSFEQLSSFRFFVTGEMLNTKADQRTGADQILRQLPQEVRALDQKEVSLQGFMLPMKLEGRLATEFLLLKSQGLCCYGNPPKITEWVNVRVNGKGVRPIMDQLVTVCGTFHVGDVRENGDLLGIYRLDADKLKGHGQ
jgi:hypothetical protein